MVGKAVNTKSTTTQRIASQSLVPDETLVLDHRKRRRNRLALSCVNCHQAKRSCDRKRPCSRCVQLGITGLCVYEVDKEVAREDSANENLRLRRRIAELESVVRGLKNSPHPRWAATGVPTEELPKMYRRRNRDQKSDTEPDNPATEITHDGQVDSCVEAFIPMPSPAVSEETSQSTLSEAVFLPAPLQQPLQLPTEPQPPATWCNPFDPSFLLDTSAFSFPTGAAFFDSGLPQSHPTDSWIPNSIGACDDWSYAAQAAFVDQLGPFDWQGLINL